jgi:caffeoyl-CoA O-methyltransferase
MSNRTRPLTDDLYSYMVRIGVRETDLLRRLRAETAAHPQANMQIAPEQGQFMAFLVRALGVKKALEVGVFTGYSSLSVAMALPDDGHLIACDVSEEFTAVARRYWEEAGVADRIDLVVGDAADSLHALIRDGHTATFDFAFIDADKTGYPTYFERVLTLLRPGGVVLLDNTFMSGRVSDPDEQGEHVQAIRDINEALHEDARIELCVLPVGDGLTMAMKR